MSDIRTEIKFGATFAVSQEWIAQSKGDVIAWSQSKAARELGEEIAKAKGFKPYPEDDMYRGEIMVYAFTINELRDFIEAKTKQKLIEMSQRDSEKDIADRLLMLSERV